MARPFFVDETDDVAAHILTCPMFDSFRSKAEKAGNGAVKSPYP
jgi:hypothetical protein